jgi:glucose/arabinose dehydrogenase
MSPRPRFAWIAGILVPIALAQLGANCDGFVAATPVVTGLTAPIHASAPLSDERLFVVERAGRIRVTNPETGAIQPTSYLDISAQVSTAGEGGLLSVAFDPSFATNRRLYVYYIEAGTLDSVVARFTAASVTATTVSLSTRQEILRVDQPAATNHKGGTIVFSPVDRFLYLGLGDGGSDSNTAQTGSTLLGKILRINVSGAGAGYTIPPNNPFVSNPAIRDEVWALGLRNPYRIAFDRATGALWIADVGQSELEEVNYQLPGVGGRNYGWPVHEGRNCYNTSAPGGPCENPNAPVRFTFPVSQYGHDAGCSITGGVPYRGAGPFFQGVYFFADFCSERFYSLDPNGTRLELTNRLAQSGAVFSGISSIVEDGFGEIYVTNLNSGVVHHLDLNPQNIDTP